MSSFVDAFLGTKTGIWSVCSKCHTPKQLHLFPRDRNRRTGYRGVCSKCCARSTQLKRKKK